MDSERDRALRPAADRATAVEPVPVSPLRDGIPSAEIFARASELASKRYPEGANASKLAALVREAYGELVAPQRPVQLPLRHNDLVSLSAEMQSEVRRICGETTALHAPDLPPCTKKGHACHRCQDLAAQAIETRRAETREAGFGAKPESAVPERDAPESPQPTPRASMENET